MFPHVKSPIPKCEHHMGSEQTDDVDAQYRRAVQAVHTIEDRGSGGGKRARMKCKLRQTAVAFQLSPSQ